MTYWIFPWKQKYFDLYSCLADYGFLEWRQKGNPDIGDVVFIYAASPIRQLLFMAKVTKINIPYSETINKSHLTDNYYYSNSLKPSDYYFRMEVISTSDLGNSQLSYSTLKTHGLKSSLQGPVKISGSLLNHIIENFDVVIDNKNNEYIEGEAIRRSITSYERNQFAKGECIKHFGYCCQICGFNFAENYGDVGKDFIHVHHITFISSNGGIAHEVNPHKDLIPVCPNCHAMLHRKINGRYLSPSELKECISLKNSDENNIAGY